MAKTTNSNQFIFLAIPFTPGSAMVREAVSMASQQAGHQLLHAEQMFAPSQRVLDGIREGISRASLVIADATARNANVMWELGYAQALAKPILLMTQDPGSIPFDLSSFRVVTYQLGSSMASLAARLADAISKTLSGEAVRPASVRPGARNQVFFSYSHSDSEYLDRILIHLRPVERSGAINLWSDTKINAGDRWRDEVRRAVQCARIAILLVSADFLASEFIATNELPPLLAAAEEDGARVIPVIIKPSRFLREDGLARFQAINNPKTPVIRMEEADREELYAKLAEVIEEEVHLE